jgi:hypothetical protein
MSFSTLLENNNNLFSVYKFNKFRCGDSLDGGYTIGNIDVNYDCFISAGISNNDNFSIDFLKKYKLNINDCYAFDGTIEKLPSNLINIMTFIKKNIGYNNNEQFTNFDDLTEKYNNIFLKMDIEGGEWPWLLSMNNEKLNKISQIVIELHGLTNTSWHNMTIDSFCSYDEKIVCLKKLEKTHYLVHAHGNNADRVANNGMPNVMELTYVNKRFFNELPELNTRPLPIEGLDFPNEKRMPDINLNFFPFVSIDIQKLKNDGRNYTNEQFLRLLQVISKNNIININLSTPEISSITRLVKILEVINNENEEVVNGIYPFLFM